MKKIVLMIPFLLNACATVPTTQVKLEPDYYSWRFVSKNVTLYVITTYMPDSSFMSYDIIPQVTFRRVHGKKWEEIELAKNQIISRESSGKEKILSDNVKPGGYRRYGNSLFFSVFGGRGGLYNFSFDLAGEACISISNFFCNKKSCMIHSYTPTYTPYTPKPIYIQPPEPFPIPIPKY